MKPKNHDDFNNQNDPDVQKLKDKDKFFKKPDGSDTFHDPDGVQQKHKGVLLSQVCRENHPNILNP